MISDERLKALSDINHVGSILGEEIAEIAKELLAHRKAWREPVCYVNASDIERKELHVLARQIQSKSCAQPLYRKPFTD